MTREYPGTPIKRGDQGEAVKAIQARLGVQQTGLYGEYSEECVTNFQRTHRIGLTGIVGKQTWRALFAPAPPADLGEKALAFAKTQVGIKEQPLGSNRGPEVDSYLASVGLEPGNFWCVAFVYYCANEAARRLDRPNPLPKTGSCSRLYTWAKENGLLVSKPEPGDIFLCIGGETGHYHTGFMAGPISSDRFPTIEGNSNSDGSANGIEVASRSPGRRLASCHYVRL